MLPQQRSKVASNYHLYGSVFHTRTVVELKQSTDMIKIIWKELKPP